MQNPSYYLQLNRVNAIEPLARPRLRPYGLAFGEAGVCDSDSVLHPLVEKLYPFESLDGSAFQGELPVDEEGMVLGSPGLFQQVQV